MDKTLVIAVMTLVLVPLIVAAMQNTILRLGKKDDLTIARETLLAQREAAIENRRAALSADLEADLLEAKAKIAQLEAATHTETAVHVDMTVDKTEKVREKT